MIEDYLNRNHIVDEDTLLKVKEINDELNTMIPDEEVSRNTSWNLKRFEFSNMFSYGENNVIDFGKLNGIIGLFAPNASGKSALLDALSFCLFDTSSRTYKADRILNNKKGTFHCKVNFEVGGLDYFVERHAKKQKNGHVKVNVDFWMIDEGGDKISLNGDQRRTTDAHIRRVIGTYEDFVLTSLSSQDNSNVFIDTGQKERKELLSQFMGINIFNELYHLASEDIKDVHSVLKNFQKEDHSKQLAEIETGLSEKLDDRKQIKSVKKGLDSQRSDLNKTIISLNKQIKPIDESITNIDKLNEAKSQLEKSLSDVDLRLGVIKTEKTENQAKISELQSRIDNYTDININQQYLELQQYETERNETKIEIDKLKIEVRNKLDKIDKLGNLEYDPDCNYCMDNIFVKDAISTEKDLDSDKKLAKKYVNKIDKIDSILSNMSGVKDEKVNFDRSLEALKTINIKQTKYDSEVDLLKSNRQNTIEKIKIVDEKILDYKEMEHDIKNNKVLENEIKENQNVLDDLKIKIGDINSDLQNIHGEIQVFRSSKKSIMDTMEKVKVMEKKYEAYEYYLDSIKRDGIPYELIEKSLPTIEGEVNDILSQIVDFNVILEMDGKNINTYIVYDEDNVWPLELCSGMEKFVSSLSLRTALINVSNLPRSNFLAIDEGWGKMDADNLNSVYMLFQYLKGLFQFTLIVSHIESMRDTVDSLVEISTDGGFSSLKLPAKFN